MYNLPTNRAFAKSSPSKIEGVRRSMITKNLIFCCLLFLTLVSCDRSHDGNLDSTFETQLVDIVTYTGLDDDKHATFRLDGRDDDPAVMLYTKADAPSKVKVNERLLLTYAVNHRAPDGSYYNIDAIGFTRIINDSIRVNAKPLNTYSMRPIKLNSTWRTGEFINLYGQVEYTEKNRFLYMMIDKETKYNDTVQAYLVHDLLDTPADSIFYWRDVYMSINIGALKSPSAPCRVLRLNINDTNNPSVTHRDYNIK